VDIGRGCRERNSLIVIASGKAGPWGWDWIFVWVWVFVRNQLDTLSYILQYIFSRICRVKSQNKNRRPQTAKPQTKKIKAKQRPKQYHKQQTATN
jgi:hypothetical protein